LRLDRGALLRGVAHLSRVDGDLAAVARRHGPPPLWQRRPGFATLMRIVLEQQVSLASARAAFDRVECGLGGVSAPSVAAAGVDGLRRLGVTRQKASYCVDLAGRVASGALDLRRVGRAPENAARAMLQEVRGIGPWTTDVYLLMALGRPDVWPVGDIALLTALKNLRGFTQRPSNEMALRDVERWRPWRAVGARMLWHGYLEGSLRGGA
jgi:DNA-3-methyladenine glycosylase II